MKRSLLFLIVLLLVVKTALAALSFPALSGRVVDEAGILSQTTRTQLDQTLAAYEQASTNQIVVVTLKSLQGDSIEDYGYQLGRFWGIGQKGKDNGVVLIVAPHERKIRIEVGYGLEATLTDAKSNEIIQTVIVPDFRSGNMERGVTDGVAAILTTLNGGNIPALSTQPPAQPLTIINVLWLFFFIGLFLWNLFSRTRGWVGSGIGLIGGLGGSSSGGFSGGGGSFGGGGASGGW